jgi:hypothetical protein
MCVPRPFAAIKGANPFAPQKEKFNHKIKSISFWSEYFKIVLIAQAATSLVGIGQLRQKHT